MLAGALVVASLVMVVDAGTAPMTPPGMIFLRGGEVDTGCFAEDMKAPVRPPLMKTVRVSGFWMDRAEVTVAAYRKCVAAGACSPPFSKPGISNFNLPGREQHPVNAVTWPQADSYCRWVGKRLPTEAEWDRAAQGPAPNDHQYVWGEGPPDCEHVAGVRSSMEHPPEQNPGLCVNDHEGFAQTLPVCSRPKGNSPEGICDLSGNVAEWVADLFIPKPRPREFANKPIPPQPRDEGDEGPRHVVKGGAGHYRSHTARSRWACHQALMWDNGFRCAKDGAAR